MSNYSKATNFAAKDSLAHGDPSKIVKGTEIDNEFNAIASAIASKVESADIAAAIAALPPGGGRVVQSLTSIGTDYSVSSGGWLATGHLVTITPTSTASKILVMVNGGSNWNHNRADLLNNQTKIYRNGSPTAALTDQDVYIYGADMSRGGVVNWNNSMILLDSPASVSAQTYQTYVTGEFTYSGAIMVVLEIL